MIFDVKLDLMRKARFITGGHWTDTPSHLTYSSVITRESVPIAFLIAALNDIEILSADVGNAYPQLENACTQPLVWNFDPIMWVKLL
jgi:hypothetical protein